MRRFAMDKLLDWKKKSNRKPLILMGARQVGKRRNDHPREYIDCSG